MKLINEVKSFPANLDFKMMPESGQGWGQKKTFHSLNELVEFVEAIPPFHPKSPCKAIDGKEMTDVCLYGVNRGAYFMGIKIKEDHYHLLAKILFPEYEYEGEKYARI